MFQSVRLTDLQDSDSEFADPLSASFSEKKSEELSRVANNRGQLRKSKSDAESHLSSYNTQRSADGSDKSDDDENLFHFSPTLTPSPSYSNPKEEKSHRTSIASSISEFFSESKSKVTEKTSDPTGTVSTGSSSATPVRPDRLVKSSKILPVLQAHLQSPRASASIDTFSSALNAGANFIRKRKEGGSKKEKKKDSQKESKVAKDTQMEGKSSGSEDVKNLSALQQKLDSLQKKFDSLKSKGQSDSKSASGSGATSDVRLDVGGEKVAFDHQEESVQLVSQPSVSSAPTATNQRKVVAPMASGQSRSPAKKVACESQSLFLQYYRQIIGVALLAFTWCFDTPGFLCGLLWGVYVSVLTVMFFAWVYFPAGTQDEDEITLDTVEIAEMNEAELAEAAHFTGILYRGWMNELTGHYDPTTHHINQTKSVFVRLDHSILRLSRPKHMILRHAFWQEPMRRSETSFVSQKMFDITGATVVLRPKNLARRRWWSRKYPICIILQPKAEMQINGLKVEEILSPKDIPKEENFKDDTDGTDAEVDDDEFLDLKPGANLINPSQSVKFGTANTRRSGRDKRKIIYLFGRSAREKEFWFQRLKRAACHFAYERDPNNHLQVATRIESPPESPTGVGRSRTASTSEFYHLKDESDTNKDNVRRSLSASVLREAKQSTPAPTTKDEAAPAITEWILYAALQQKFNRYMGNSLYDKDKVEAEAKPRELVNCDLSAMIWKIEDSKSSDINIAWANAFAARIFWDFTRDQVWIDRVRDRVQRKLSTIRLPYFIETLTLTKLEPAMCVPKINSVSEPVLNEWGLWVDLGLVYAGGLTLVLETKINMMKLKDQGGKSGKGVRPKPTSTRYSDSELPESPESSADEEPPMINIPILSKKDDGTGSPKQSAGKKILQMVDTVTHSKYFEKLTDINIVKKWMQDVSETRLILMVQLKYLEGTLCLNIPPPPTDRLWHGFRAVPTITLRAYPKLGDKAVNFAPLTEWIEAKLKSLFEKNIVLPNMDDFVVPLMHGSPLLNCYNL